MTAASTVRRNDFASTCPYEVWDGREFVGAYQTAREAAARLRNASELSTGDVFLREGVRVTVVRDAEPAQNRFGLTWFQLWCRREDTGAEGYCTFGSGGVVVSA
jgi:hypothetical protein